MNNRDKILKELDTKIKSIQARAMACDRAAKSLDSMLVDDLGRLDMIGMIGDYRNQSVRLKAVIDGIALAMAIVRKGGAL